MNPFVIHEPCIKIANNQLIFEIYRITLNRDKYYTEVQNEDAIKHKRLSFDFMQQKSNQLDGFYLREICL